jgi:hypothetical protein
MSRSSWRASRRAARFCSTGGMSQVNRCASTIVDTTDVSICSRRRRCDDGDRRCAVRVRHRRADRAGHQTAFRRGSHRCEAILSPVTRGVRHDRLPTACRLLAATECRRFRVGSGWNPKNRCQSPPSDTDSYARALVRSLRGSLEEVSQHRLGRIVPACEWCGRVGVVAPTPVFRVAPATGPMSPGRDQQSAPWACRSTEPNRRPPVRPGRRGPTAPELSIGRVAGLWKPGPNERRDRVAANCQARLDAARTRSRSPRATGRRLRGIAQAARERRDSLPRHRGDNPPQGQEYCS